MRALIKFLGGVADNNLTGSSSLLQIQVGRKKLNVLIDVGLIQDRFHDSIEKNRSILNVIRPSDIDFIVLTHSHIDHIGRLPLLVKDGFSGRIICTIGTRGLLQVMLEDSAKIQMAEAGYLSKRLEKEARPAHKKSHGRQYLTRGKYDRIKRKKKETKPPHYLPLYTIEDVNLVDELVKNGGYPYHQWIRLSHNVSLKFYPSGHVMGGAIVVIRINDKDEQKIICFSGDLGRQDGIILPPPERIKEPADCLVLESTYGGRRHPERNEEIIRLLDLIGQTEKFKRRLIIPSFTLERAQEIIYLLSYHMAKGDIPAIPIYLDSPLGNKITSVFSAGWESKMFSDQNRLDFNPFDPGQNSYLRVITSQEESDTLASQPSSYVVIAGSGMCDAGRVRGHLRANLSKQDTTVCLVGYMAENTLGRRLKEQHHSVRMNKEEIVVKAEIVSFDSFSAHADSLFLAQYALSVLAKKPNNPKSVYLIHGGILSATDLKSDIEDVLSAAQKKMISISIPKLNETIYV